MGNTWITNMDHFLENDGLPALELPRPAELLMDYLGSIIEAVTEYTRASNREVKIMTDIRCRRRPKRIRCNGKIVAFIKRDDQDRIIWECPICNDNGIIYAWEESIWDKTKTT